MGQRSPVTALQVECWGSEAAGTVVGSGPDPRVDVKGEDCILGALGVDQGDGAFPCAGDDPASAGRGEAGAGSEQDLVETVDQGGEQAKGWCADDRAPLP